MGLRKVVDWKEASGIRLWIRRQGLREERSEGLEKAVGSKAGSERREF